MQIFTKIYARARNNSSSIFYVKFNRFEFFCFPSRLVAIPTLKGTVCPIILNITGERIVGFIPFPKVLGLYEMQTASSGF